MKLTYLPILFLLLIGCTNSKALAKKKTNETSAKKEKNEIKTIAEATKKCTKIDGLFPIYQDTINGDIYLEINKNQLNKEFIYFSYIENGITDARLNRGSYRGSKIFKIAKNFNRIELSLPNTDYYFDPNNAISKASNANINEPIVISEEIIGTNDTTFLIKAKSLFIGENFATIVPNYPSGYTGFKIGKLSDAKSSIESVRNYPKNTDIRTRYVFENSGSTSIGNDAVTDGRFVSISYHHSIIEVPENNYKPRRDDPRIGYFMIPVTDLTSDSPTPFKDMINRWHLVKKDPTAALSEPVEPITWWMENTTPVELRPIIKEGVESWNVAFEQAGFKNAIVVKMQPDTATWDAGDIRYNVLRWTSSPNPPFGGYGPCLTNPRTGEILGADIMLEYVYVLGRLKSEKYFDIEKSGLHMDDEHFCSAGNYMQEQVHFAYTAMQAMELTDIEKNDFLVQSIKRLVLHEVGHTLGLNHNMKGSTIQSVEDIKNKEKIEKEGLCNSVMEYPAINFAKNPKDQTLYYDYKPGFYDLWAIEYAYTSALENPEEEEKRLTRILSRSNDPKLVFGNDADDMRSPGKGIDPMVNIFDLSNDPVQYGVERIQLIDDTLIPKLVSKFSKPNQSYQELYNAFTNLLDQKGRMLDIMTRQIAGVYVNRAMDNTNETPYTTVPYAKQKAAIAALNTYAFSPKAFEFEEDLLKHLQQQRRGFNFFSTAEDPKIHEEVLGIQKGLLDHLLHPNVLNRAVNTQLYGNTYSLNEYLTDLTASIFKEDKQGNVTYIRQHLQVEYTDRLIDYLENKKALESTKSLVLAQILEIENIAKLTTGDPSTKAHRKHLELLINKMKAHDGQQ